MRETPSDAGGWRVQHAPVWARGVRKHTGESDGRTHTPPHAHDHTHTVTRTDYLTGDYRCSALEDIDRAIDVSRRNATRTNQLAKE